jgi:hypothetical protein
LDLYAITDAAREALEILREGETFEWSTVTLLGLAMYVYAVEVERQRWDIILAGIAFWLMDWFNELVNSLIFHASDRAPLWTVTGDTSFLILIGLNIEICLLFLISGVVFVKFLPPQGHRVLFVFLFSTVCVVVELFLEWTGYFTWEYWWWNTETFPVIILLGYATFFAVAAWVYDMGDDRRRQLRVVGTLAAVNVALAVGLGLGGWL